MNLSEGYPEVLCIHLATSVTLFNSILKSRSQLTDWRWLCFSELGWAGEATGIKWELYGLWRFQVERCETWGSYLTSASVRVPTSINQLWVSYIRIHTLSQSYTYLMVNKWLQMRKSVYDVCFKISCVYSISLYLSGVYTGYESMLSPKCKINTTIHQLANTYFLYKKLIIRSIKSKSLNKPLQILKPPSLKRI